MEKIMQVVSDYYKINPEELLSYDKNTLLARQIAIYLSRTITGESFLEIGHKFGSRDHAVIMYACEKIKQEMLLDKKIAATIETLKEMVIKPLQVEKNIMDNEKFWSQFLEQIQKEVSDQDFNSFFKDIELKERTDSTILIEFPNNFTKEWINNNHEGIFARIASLISGTTLNVKTLIRKRKKPYVKTITL